MFVTASNAWDQRATLEQSTENGGSAPSPEKSASGAALLEGEAVSAKALCAALQQGCATLQEHQRTLLAVIAGVEDDSGRAGAQAIPRAKACLKQVPTLLDLAQFYESQVLIAWRQKALLQRAPIAECLRQVEKLAYRLASHAAALAPSKGHAPKEAANLDGPESTAPLAEPNAELPRHIIKWVAARPREARPVSQALKLSVPIGQPHVGSRL